MAERTEHISVVGLGKLGAPLVACLASKGFRLIGLDVDVEKVNHLRAGRAPVQETGLQELIEHARERISATQDYEERYGKEKD